ncbi:HAD family hydrolase [Cellulomonas sp. NS3]|uniref:HAD family hydrolase n=1 Tax=Cellulomonas sp. NS3 TaxID=2973977 RepID=UPI0021634755|nr:HAD family hydrolase [Cellulomonas sp. NS3]
MPSLLRAPRLVATDLDGTLLRSDGSVSPRTRAALVAAERAGIEVVFVTARPPRWLQDVRDVVGRHGIAICANGAAVLDVRADVVLAERAMDSRAVSALVARVRDRLPGTRFAVERRAGILAEQGFVGPHPLPAGAPVVAVLEPALDDGTYKLLARRPGEDPAAFLRDVAGVLGADAVLADSGAVGLAEVTGPGVTKASTLATWAEERGLGPDDVWAFGDAPNDLPMLAWAGVSFAVGNAHPDVAGAASRRCAANDDDGVAEQLEAALRLLEDAPGYVGPAR